MFIAALELEFIGRARATLPQHQQQLSRQSRSGERESVVKFLETSTATADSYPPTSPGISAQAKDVSSPNRQRMASAAITSASNARRRRNQPKISDATSAQMVQAGTLYSLGRVLLRQGRHDEAEPLLQQAVDLFIEVHGSFHPRVAFGLTTLAGCISVDKTKRRQALRILDRATDILRSTLNVNHNDIADSGGPLFVKVKLLEISGQTRKAQRALKQVQAIRNTHYSNDHPKCVEVTKWLERLEGLQLCEENGGERLKLATAVAKAGAYGPQATATKVVKLAKHKRRPDQHIAGLNKEFVCTDCGSKTAKWALPRQRGKSQTIAGLDSPPGQNGVVTYSVNAASMKTTPTLDQKVPVCQGCYDAQVALRLARARWQSKARALCTRKWRKEIALAKVATSSRFGLEPVLDPILCGKLTRFSSNKDNRLQRAV